MRRILVYISFFLVQIFFAQQTKQKLPLIPLPQEVTLQQGVFLLSDKTTFFIMDGRLQKELAFFNDWLKVNNGFVISQTMDPLKSSSIKVETNNAANRAEGAYTLVISPEKVTITGDSTGVFYAFQTLIQLINEQSSKEIKLTCLSISDKPAYQWRGMHLDVCRHFFPVSFVKRYIDLLASYKFNTFHWHLTDDQGWRIEIKKFPKLTQVGAWRKGSMIGKYDDHKYDSITYGGFYTQEEIKEVLTYAQQRHITVVPEIEMPGHAVAAIAAYPYLSCTGKTIEVEKGWGVFEDVFCPKDSTFEFLEDVLREVMALFPGKYIHIGGDECPKTSWKKCPHCQTLIKTEGLKDEHELQSYFIKRMERFVNARGRQIIGWDEILEGGLPPNAAVMSWRGTEGGISAAKEKHKVVMSPGRPCYFDHYQSRDKTKEPLAIGGFNPLDSVYAYDPTPNNLSEEERKYILGAQANIWTEYILTSKQVEYMAVPRMCALSEVLWTNKNKKKYSDFIERLKENSKLLDRMQVDYAKHFFTKK